MPTAPTKFIWYELNTPDPKAAAAFYGHVLGWEAKPFGDGQDYTVVSAAGVNVGGIMGLPADACEAHAHAGWVGYLGVDDVDATAVRIRAAGGSILREPTDIPGVGRFAVAADPNGAVFLLIRGWSPEGVPEAPAGTPGHVGWRELHAGEGKAAFDFYAGLFGWTADQAFDMGPLGTYQLFAAGGPAVGGIMTKTPEAPRPFWSYYFVVDALEPALARARERGGKLCMGPHQVPDGSWIAQCQDPQGAWFALMSARQG